MRCFRCPPNSADTSPRHPHAFRPALLKLGGPQQPPGSLWHSHVQSTPHTMKSDFQGWTRRRDRFHPDCSEQLRANPPPRGPVGPLCEMSREGTHSNQGFHECHTYSLTSVSQPVRFTHSEVDLEVPIQDARQLWLKEQRSPSLAPLSACGKWARKHYLRLSPASVSSWDKPSGRLATKDLR